MPDRTTVNVDKPNHRKANQVKTLYGDSWPEVLEFYWKHRGNGYMFDKAEPMQEVDMVDMDLTPPGVPTAEEIAAELDSAGVDEKALGEALADYLMNEYHIPEKIASEMGGR